MIRRNSALISCLLMASTAGFIAGQPFPAPLGLRGPKGIHVTFGMGGVIGSAQNAAHAGTPPAYPDAATDAVIVAYFTTLLDNPAVSGLAPQIGWDLLNPNDPGFDPLHPANAYIWNPLDDLFIAVDQWNRSHQAATPKTIQLIVSAGFNAPAFVFSNIDNSVCGDRNDCTGAGSCDGLFMTAKPAVSPQCGYTTLFFKVEGGPLAQLPFPLPWNPVYKTNWQTFLMALNQRIQQEPSSSAFVSIAIAGPTASTAEMILPSTQDQHPYTCSGELFLGETLVNQNPVCPATPPEPEFDVPTAWNLLFQNHYGPDPKYQNSDLAIIQEWDAAIDTYSRVFSGVTLVLTTTTDAFPTFPGADPSLLIPAPGFESDCDDGPPPGTNDPNKAMACAAVTQILQYFTNPFVGGFNAKATQESGMTAARDGMDLGTNGIKWLAATTAGGVPFRMSRILGGLQFSHDFSSADTLQSEGCPDYPTNCAKLTPAEGLENVLSISFFPGTAVGPFFCAYTDPSVYGCASTSVDYANWKYSDAPMNYVQIYDTDILYASGLSQCSTLEITGRPASSGTSAKPPDVSTCAPLSPPDAPTAQAELSLASQKLLTITETPSPY